MIRRNMVRRRLTMIGLVIFVVIFGLGAQRCPFLPTEHLECSTITLSTEAGYCSIMRNPCFDSGEWDTIAHDAIVLVDSPEGVSLRTTRTDDVISREVCASSSISSSPLALGYYYTRGDDSGSGQIFLSVHIPMRVEVRAFPGTVPPGGESDLEAMVAHGSFPYSYNWSPAESLNDPHSAYPIASPLQTTTYTVIVTDSLGETATGSVTVNVGLPTPTPTPEPTPSPTPAPTPVPIAAFFTFNVLCCPTLILDASGSTGPVVSYTWDLSWTPLSPDLVTQSPTAQFAINETNRGTINLTVADVGGNTSTFSRNF